MHLELTVRVRRHWRGYTKAVLGSEGYSAPSLDPDPDGFIDTEYPCRIDRERNLLIVSGPPAGMIHVGGYRFAWREVQALISDLGDGASIAALPDRLAGHRLAGVAADRERIGRALEARGANPLIAAARLTFARRGCGA